MAHTLFLNHLTFPIFKIYRLNLSYPFKTKLSNIELYDNYPINLSLIDYKKTDTDTSKTSKKSSKKKKDTKKSKETDSLSEKTQKNDYETILSILFDGCKNISILNFLNKKDIFKKYNSL